MGLGHLNPKSEDPNIPAVEKSPPNSSHVVKENCNTKLQAELNICRKALMWKYIKHTHIHTES